MTDVAVIGGGIIGLATARALCLRGARVTVLERGMVASGTSSRGEGNMLVSDKELGPEAALALRSLELWRRFAGTSSVPFEYEEKGGLVAARTERQLSLLAEQSRRQQQLGIASTVLGQPDLRDVEPSLSGEVLGAVRYPQDAQVMPIHAAMALAVAARELGATIRTGVTVRGLDQRGERLVLRTSTGAVETDRVVNAAGPWAGDVAASLGGRVEVFPRRGLLLVTERVPAGTVRHKVYDGRYIEAVGSDEAAAQVAPVIESTQSGTILIGSTREAVGWDRQVPWDLAGALAREAMSLVPVLANRLVIRVYQGFRPATPDHLPLIGPDRAVDGLFHHTGHEGAGIGLALGSAEVLADAVMDGRVDPAFDPGRLGARSSAEGPEAIASHPAVSDGHAVSDRPAAMAGRTGAPVYRLRGEGRGRDGEGRSPGGEGRSPGAEGRSPRDEGQGLGAEGSGSPPAGQLFCAIGHCFSCVAERRGTTVRTCLGTDPTAKPESAVGGHVGGLPAAERGEVHPPDRHPPIAEPTRIRGCLVIGAGPGGVTAATWAARSGVDVVLIDRYPRPGGQIARQPNTPGPAVGPYARMLEGLPGEVERWYSAEVTILRRDGGAWQAMILREGHLTELRAHSIVLATGAREVVTPFPGWTLPGVMTVGGVQAQLKRTGSAPARRIGLAGSGPLLLAVAAALTDAGTAPLAVAEQQPLTGLAVRGATTGAAFPSKVAAFGRLALGGVTSGARPPRFGWRVAEAVGGSRLRAVVLEKTDGSGKRTSLALDVLGISHALIPDVALAIAVGCDTRPSNGGPAIRVDSNQETSTAGVFAIGEVTGVGGADKAVAEGYVAGMVIGMRVGDGAGLPDQGEAGLFAVEASVRDQAIAEAVRWRSFADRLGRLYPVDHSWVDRASDDTVVCRCEEVPLGAVRDARERGATTPRAIKGLTRCGMGYCQGAVCGPVLGSLAGHATAASGPARPEQVSGPTGLEAKPLAVPVPLEQLARLEAAGTGQHAGDA